MRINVDLASPSDDAAIRQLMRQPMPGRITVAFEREPDFTFGCAVTGEDHRILVARSEEDGIIGVACRTLRNVFVNGCELRLGYLGDLRVDDRFRGRWLVSRGFSFLRQLHEGADVPAYLVAVVEGNREAMGVLVEKRRRHFPEFHLVANYSTLAVDVHRSRPSLPCPAQISRANDHDLPEIARFLHTHGCRKQFFPSWNARSLRALSRYGLEAGDFFLARKEGQIAGVIALWDQTAYKQTVIKSYSGWLKTIAPIWNSGASRLLGRNPLPRPGETLRSAYASLVCIAQDNAEVFASLVREVYNLAHARGFRYLMLGLDDRDPLLPVARSYSHILYPSRLYLAEWSDGGHIHERLEQRPAYVDIATL